MNIDLLEGILLAKKEPVSFREFVSGQDYCSNSDLYEFWYKEEKDIPEKCSELILDGSLGGGKCVPGRVRVLLDGKYPKIESLCQQEEGFIPHESEIELWNGTKVKTSHTYKQKKQTVFNLVTDCSRTVSGTGKHKVLALTQDRLAPSMTRMDKLKVGDFILRRKLVKIEGGYTPALELAFKNGTKNASSVDQEISRAFSMKSNFRAMVLLGIIASRSYYTNSSINFTWESEIDNLKDLLDSLDIIYRVRESGENVFLVRISSHSVETLYKFIEKIMPHVVEPNILNHLKDIYTQIDRLNSEPVEVNSTPALQKEFMKNSEFFPRTRYYLQNLKNGIDINQITRINSEFQGLGLYPLMECPDFNLDNCYFERIESIYKTVEDVYDLSVPGHHVFMAQGCLNHNTWFSNYYLAYRLYCLFLNGDPRPDLGVAKDTEVYILYFSVSLTMAKKSGFKNLYNIFKSCKWFKDNYPIDTSVQSSIRFPNGFYIDYASSEGHQIGLTVWAFILDEANFRSGVGEGLIAEYADVTELYTQLQDRLTSRFSKKDGSINALSILISSASYQSSFVEKRKQLKANNPYCHNIRAVAYKIKPERYSKETFEVFIGYGAIEATIVQDETHKEKIIKGLEISDKNYVSKLFEKVPLSILSNYKENLSRALQNHSGIATFIQGRFIQDMKIVRESYTCDEPEIIVPNIITLSNLDDIELMDYFKEENIRYPERPHALFLDLSVTGDSGGLSCVRFDGSANRQNYHTHVFTIEIIPPPAPGQTRITKVKNFVIELAAYLNIVAFGSDQYQSTQIRQDILNDLGLKDTRLSIDSSDIFHFMWLRMVTDKVLKMRYIYKLDKEIEEGEHDRKRRRVIRSDKTTDDLWQSVVGAAFLSETVSASEGSLDDIPKLNLVGPRSINKLIKRLGYS